jgi:regulatory protein
MNPARLERIAVAHLERFGSSVENLRRVLRRRIARSCEHHDEDPAAFEAPLEEVIARLQRIGVLDDRRYGQGLVRSARARGTSGLGIRMKLRQKGLEAGLCDELLRDEAGEDAETEAAWHYARRRRLGPFRNDAELRREHRQRDLAALGRRGFGYPVACSVIDADDDDAPPMR